MYCAEGIVLSKNLYFVPGSFKLILAIKQKLL